MLKYSKKRKLNPRAEETKSIYKQFMQSLEGLHLMEQKSKNSMRQLHNKPSQQQQYRSASIMHNGIELLKDAGDNCVLFTSSYEFTYKRPENIRMQK